MKKITTTSLLIITLLLVPALSNAQDGFFSDARTFSEGAAEIGIQPVYLSEQEDFMLMFRGGYGFTTGLSGHAKVGVFDDEIYAGAHLEANLASEPASAISIAVLGGIYTYGDLGLKTGVNISKLFEPVALYTGINYQPLFLNNTTLHSVLVPVGLDIHLRQTDAVDLVAEANIPVNDDAQFLEAITFGARFYLN